MTEFKKKVQSIIEDYCEGINHLEFSIDNFPEMLDRIETEALRIYGVGRSTGMECLHCQKDYIDDTIIVQYEGVYNYNEMMEYVNRCYGNVKGEVIEHEEPSEWQGYKNMGSVLIR